MKEWSIKKKLVLLCGALISSVLIVGGVEMYGGHLLSDNLENMGEVQMPAVRNMTLADMMHDGLRAVAFRALYVGEKGDAKERQEVAEELKEMTENISKYVDTIDKLPVQSDVKAAIGVARKDIEVYVKAAEEITGLALAGRRDLAYQKIPKFQEAFEGLEKTLGDLGELIEKDADESRINAAKLADRINLVGLVLVGLGLVFSLFISFVVVRDLMRTLAATIEQLSNSSREVSLASGQSASSATELSEASTEQAASLQETMASVEEISAMVSQNAESAVKVKAAVDANQAASDEGAASIGEMMRAIGEIKGTNDRILHQMETGNKEFGEIVKIIAEIGDKTKVINDIVFQTKLLSFNASVEAARAGEHGKGFAVVAEEVGNLAQMSGNAAKEISDMLTGSIKKVNEIVEQTTQQVDQLVEVGKDKISMGQATAERCRGALEKIAANARTVAAMIGEITHASKEQAQGIQEINKAISQLDQVTQQNSAVAQQSSVQADQLNTEAQALTAAVNLLVEFANGKNSALPERHEAPISFAGAVRKRQSAVPTVVRKTGTKAASGASSVPSSNDPGFEEF